MTWESLSKGWQLRVLYDIVLRTVANLEAKCKIELFDLVARAIYWSIAQMLQELLGFDGHRRRHLSALRLLLDHVKRKCTFEVVIDKDCEFVAPRLGKNDVL